jgi:glycosyltransferase involved in cell wall biosynthesis
VEKNVERSVVRVCRDLLERHPSPTSHAQRLPLQTMLGATATSFVPSATTSAGPGPPPAPSVRIRPPSVAARAPAELVSRRYQAKSSDIGAGGPRGADGSAADLQPEVISIGAISELSSSPGVGPTVRAPFPRNTIAWHELWRWYQSGHSQYRLSRRIIGDDPSQPQLAVEAIARDLSNRTHDTSGRIRRTIHAQISRQNSRPDVIPPPPENQAADTAAARPRPRRHLGLVPAPLPRRTLIVSSFVPPHAGVTEQFVDTASTLLSEHGWDVRVLACRPARGPAAADITLPTLHLPPGSWPVPVGGWRTLWREIGRADVVLAHGPRNLLPSLATLMAHVRRRKVIFVLQDSGAPFTTRSFLYRRVLGSVFDRLVVRRTLRCSHPISLSQAGVTGARSRYGVEAAHLSYPLRDLPPATPRTLDPDEPLRIVWAGRLYREENPLHAVDVVERLRLHRDATLHVYGTGVLHDRLAELAADRPWLQLGGQLGWSEVQDAHDASHLCLSTSLGDATEIAILEPLARGIPVVSTRAGDALIHYADTALHLFCVAPADAQAAAFAILRLVTSYARYRDLFAENAQVLRKRHGRGAQRLSVLLETAAFGEPGG